MGYILIQPEVLHEKGVENFEKMPDGRAIVDFSMLRVLGSMSDVEIVSTADEMLAKIKEEEESGLYPKVDPAEDTVVPPDGTEAPAVPQPETPQEETPAGPQPEEELQPETTDTTEQVKEGGSL